MSSYRDAMREYRRATRMTPEAQRRVRIRVEARSTPTRWGWALAGVGVAAVAALFFGLWPVSAQPVDRALGSEVASSAPASSAPSAPEAVPLGRDVQLAVRGRGHVTGDTRDVHVAWESGTIGVEVTPEQGIQLEVRTDEARVRVVGTGFDVTRDALGTAVSVAHGRVEVVCEGEPATFLSKGESAVCLPRTAGGMLGRARALQDDGAPLADQAAAVAAGLAVAEPGPVRAELRGLQLGILLHQGDNAGALALAEGVLADGDPVRRTEALTVAARLRAVAGECDAASPWLRELDAAGALAADDPSRLACAAALGQ